MPYTIQFGPLENIPRPDYDQALASAWSTSWQETCSNLGAVLTNTWLALYEERWGGSVDEACIRLDGMCYVMDYRPANGNGSWDPTEEILTRIIACYGNSRRNAEKRNRSRMRGTPLSASEFGQHQVDLLWDRGHYLSHRMGGHMDQGLFPQRRDINRGYGPLGKLYRSMERYAEHHVGTFVFSRPIYGDTSEHPYYIEYGLLPSETASWKIQIFPNRYSFKPLTSIEQIPEWYR